MTANNEDALPGVVPAGIKTIGSGSLTTTTRTGPKAGIEQHYSASGNLPAQQKSKRELYTQTPKFWKQADHIARDIYLALDRLGGPKPDRLLYDQFVSRVRRKLKQGKKFSHDFVRGSIVRGMMMKKQFEEQQAKEQAAKAAPAAPAVPDAADLTPPVA